MSIIGSNKFVFKFKLKNPGITRDILYVTITREDFENVSSFFLKTSNVYISNSKRC